MSIIEKALDKALEKDQFHIPERNAQGPDQDSGSPERHQPAEAAKPAAKTPNKTHKSIAIDWGTLKAKGMLIPEMASSQLAEEYRVIKRPLLMNAFPEEDNGIERANLILVTSSVPGEGKTFTAMNLALSIAMEREKTVLLIDADVAKPSISQLLGIPGDEGLIDLLRDREARFCDVAVKTDIPNFTIMPAGKQDRHSTELLASDAMKRLAKELSARYSDRVVVFDSPPLLAATQGAVLATLVGQVVLVVEADTTPQHLVQESVAKLESCEVVGCVLNKTKKGLGFKYYSYGYGYGYGYGYYGQQKNED